MHFSQQLHKQEIIGVFFIESLKTEPSLLKTGPSLLTF